MITYAIIAGFESDGNARERRSRSFLYNGNVVPVVFFCILQLLTVIIHGSPSVIKLIRLLPAFMHDVTFTASSIGSWQTKLLFNFVLHALY